MNFLHCFHVHFHHKQSDESIGAVEMVNPFVLMMWAFIIVYIYCAYAQMVTDQFGVFEKQLCQCEWHLWPIGIQQMFMIIVASAQQPASIHSYGHIGCTRYVFQKVIAQLNSEFK